MRIIIGGFLMFVGMVLFALPSRAQVLNFDKVSPPSDSAKNWSVAVQAGADFSSEKKVFDWDTKSDVTRFMDGHHLISAIFVNSFISTKGSDLQNTGFIHVRYRDNDTRKFSPEYFTQYQWDNLRGMVNRYLVGANLRIQLKESKTLDLYAGIGLMYEWEKWNFDGVDTAKLSLAHAKFLNSALVKLNQYFKISIKLFNTTDFTFTNYLQARPNKHIVTPRIADFIQWNIPVSKKFSINFNMESIYDAAPIVPIHHFYYSYITGVALSI
ncbi:MAG: hypothetical protein ABIQ31_14970 [Ferruginibacter sp.]